MRAGEGYVIRGSRRLNFFLFFGSLFGGIPFFILILMLTGSGTDQDGKPLEWFVPLFLLPFLLAGGAFFLLGLYITFGKTEVRVSSGKITVRRGVLGLGRTTILDRSKRIECDFREIYKQNEKPVYGIVLEELGGKKVSLGSSLDEESRLWLRCAFLDLLGSDEERHIGKGVSEIANLELVDIDTSDVSLSQVYKTRSMSISPSSSGWEMKQRGSGAFGLFLFGSIFALAGAIMHDGLRALIFDLVPAIEEIAKSGKSSGDVPFFFPYVFGGVGLLIIIAAIATLGYRSYTRLQADLLTVRRTWFGYGREVAVRATEVDEVKKKKSGQSGSSAQFKITLALHEGKKPITISSFRDKKDTAQIIARLDHWLRQEKPSTDGYAESISLG